MKLCLPNQTKARAGREWTVCLVMVRRGQSRFPPQPNQSLPGAQKDSELGHRIVKDFKEAFAETERSFMAKSTAFSRLNAATAPRPVKALIGSP